MTKQQEEKLKRAATAKGWKIHSDALIENGKEQITGRGFALADEEGFVVARTPSEAAINLGIAQIDDDGTVS